MVPARAKVVFAADVADGSVKRVAVTVRCVLAFGVCLMVVNFTFAMRSLCLVASVIEALQFNNFAALVKVL